MRSGARIQAAIEIIDLINQRGDEGGAAADQTIRHYFSRRRYAGSKDRRAVRHQVYWVLRRRGEIEWRLQQADQPFTGRWALLTACAMPADADTFIEEPVVALFTGGKYCPEQMTDEEQAYAQQVKADKSPALSDWAKGNYAPWLDETLKARFGAQLPGALAAMTGRAPLDMRVNDLISTRDEVLVAFKEAREGEWASTAVRIDGEKNVQAEAAFAEGWVEIQDEGSQLASLACGVAPGMTVLDYCAGAGGKALALSAQMNNEGSIYAHDSDPDRLERINPRSKRLGCDNINIIKKIEPIFNDMDRVVLDVPCSGTGTWRRSPELRWRLTPEALTGYVEQQRTLLTDGATRVAVGGQVVYITCSLLPEEDEQQIEWFLSQNDGFKLVPVADNLSGHVSQMPETLSTLPECLLLAPHKHETDGFFIAVLERLN